MVHPFGARPAPKVIINRFRTQKKLTFKIQNAIIVQAFGITGVLSQRLYTR